MNLPPRPEFRLHVGWRIIKTAFTAALVAIGVIAALLVNYFLPRERVTAAWDGLLHRLGR